MRRFLSTIAAEAVTLMLCHSALAASDITIAAIATGRLYVLGKTERPHTPVVLDDQFRTESDDKGKFQYELIYHPTRCIVSAKIDGKVYEAVVSNCGEPRQTAPTKEMPSRGASLPSSTEVAPATRPPGKPTAAPERATPEAVAPVPPPPPAPAVSNTTSSATKNVRRPESRPGSAHPVINPPLPPSRQALPQTAKVRSPQPARPPQRPKLEPQPDSDDLEALPQD